MLETPNVAHPYTLWVSLICNKVCSEIIIKVNYWQIATVYTVMAWTWKKVKVNEVSCY